MKIAPTRAVSTTAVDYAIAAAQIQRLLGKSLSTVYELRQLDEDDLLIFNEDITKNYYGASKKTHAIRLAVARKKGPGKPALAMIAYKDSSKKSVLTVRATGQDELLTAEEQSRMVILCLHTVLHYAALTSTPTIRVRRIGPRHFDFFKMLGFDVKKEGMLHHAYLHL